MPASTLFIEPYVMLYHNVWIWENSVIKTPIAVISLVFFGALNAYADRLRIVSSIAPVHAIVVAVAGERAQADLLLKGSASPHHFSLKPSHARLLQAADFVVLVDFELESFLEKPVRSSSNSTAIELANAPRIQMWETREIGVLRSEHGESHSHGHDHGRESHHDDLHLWLDPMNAIAMSDYLVSELSAADPVGEAMYRENATRFKERVELVMKTIRSQLSPYNNQPYVVFHDAFQYFEKRFGLMSPAVLTLNPEMAPSAKVVRQVREYLLSSGTRCVYREPQFSPSILGSMTEGLPITIAELDPLGDGTAIDADYYPQIILGMAQSFESCFSQP
jgi:zinc transport system substrate-binding protein